MATGVPPKKNAAFVFYCSLVSQADPRLLQSSPTLATGDVKVSLDGGALTNLATLPTVTPAAGVSVKVSLSADEMNGDDVLVVFRDAAGAEWCDKSVSIKTATRWLDDLAFPTVSGTGDVAQTGDNFARTGVNGVGLSAIPDLAGVTTLLGRLTAARAGYLDNVNNATLAGAVFPTDPADQSLVIAATTALATAIAAIADALPSGIEQNQPLAGFSFTMLSSADHLTPLPGLTVSASRSLAGAAFASCANAVVELAHGAYTLDLAAADLNARVVLLRLTASGADARFVTFVTEAPA